MRTTLFAALSLVALVFASAAFFQFPAINVSAAVLGALGR